jgi:hypothetical protein
MKRKLLNSLRWLRDLALLRLFLNATQHDGFWLGQQLFQVGNGANPTYTLRDGRYWTVPFEKWQRIAKYNWRLKYYVDRWDCDNFADLFRVLVSVAFGLNTVGTVLNQQHAWNVVVAEDGLHWFEPQTGVWVTDLTGIYSLEGARVEI